MASTIKNLSMEVKAYKEGDSDLKFRTLELQEKNGWEVTLRTLEQTYEYRDAEDPLSTETIHEVRLQWYNAERMFADYLRCKGYTVIPPSKEE